MTKAQQVAEHIRGGSMSDYCSLCGEYPNNGPAWDKTREALADLVEAGRQCAVRSPFREDWEAYNAALDALHKALGLEVDNG